MCSRPDVARARIAYSDKADEEQMVVGCNRKFWLNICPMRAGFHRGGEEIVKRRIYCPSSRCFCQPRSSHSWGEVVDVTHIRVPRRLQSPPPFPLRGSAAKAKSAFLKRAGADRKGSGSGSGKGRPDSKRVATRSARGSVRGCAGEQGRRGPWGSETQRQEPVSGKNKKIQILQ